MSIMALFARKPADQSHPGGSTTFAAHPVFTLTAGMPQAEVVDRIGPPTQTRTSADVMAEFAGPDAKLDLTKVDPEEYWSYTGTPVGFHLEILFRAQRLVEVRVRQDGSNDIVARIDDQGVAAAKSYRLALRARRL
jgi:hypothetical protein